MNPGKAAGTNESAATASAAHLVCGGCGLLCDDLAGTSDTGCAAADAWFGIPAQPAATTVDGLPATIDAAVNAAAHRLTNARRVLLTGLTSVPLEPVRLACQIAERLTAAVDAGTADTALLTGPTITRVGEVTAAFEELRDRADLVIFWGCNPAASHPRFLERFVQPARPTGGRQTMSVGPQQVVPPTAHHSHLSLAADQIVPAARLLQASLEGHGITPTDDPLAATISKLNAAVDAASCIGIVTSTRDDPSGLTAWSLGQLVRALAHRKPAFQIPLGAGTAGGGGNAAGFAASCSWRYGAPGAIAAADRDGSEFQPAEADAVRLISRGEVDCVLAVGRLAPPIEAALTAAAVAPSVIRITDITPEPAAVTTVMLGTASLARATTGTMLREDGRLMQLQPLMAPKKPTVDQLLIKLKQAIDAIRPTASTLQPAAFSGESS